MSKKILIVMTSHDRLGDTGKQTGFWLEEFAVPYYAFEDAGAELTIASPKGGEPPMDPSSDTPDQQNDATRRLKADSVAKAELANTLKLSDVMAADFDAVFYPGGHGPLWDLVSDRDSIQLIEDFWASEKPIVSVCHGPSVLVNAKNHDGEHIIKDRDVTGFSNSEEEAFGLTDVVPLLIEDAFIDRGANYIKGDDFEAFARRDGNLITGQNPASSAAVARELVELLKLKPRLEQAS